MREGGRGQVLSMIPRRRITPHPHHTAIEAKPEFVWQGEREGNDQVALGVLRADAVVVVGRQGDEG